MYKAGIDVGSTTVKVVVFDQDYHLIFSRYERHFSDVKAATIKIIQEAISKIHLSGGRQSNHCWTSFWS